MAQATPLTPVRAIMQSAEFKPTDQARLLSWAIKYQAATGKKPQVIKNLEQQQQCACRAANTNFNVVKMPSRNRQFGSTTPPTYPGAA